MRSPAVPGRVLRRSTLALACGLAAGAAGSVSGQTPPVPAPTLPPVTSAEPTVEDRLRRLEEANRVLFEQNQELMRRYDELMTRHEQVLDHISQAAPDDPLGNPAVGPMGEATTDPEARSAPTVVPGMPGSASPATGAVDAEVRSLQSGAVGPMGEATTGVGDVEGGDEGAAADEEDPFSAFGVAYDDGFVIAPVDEDKTPFLLKMNGRIQFRYVNFARARDFWWDSAGNLLPIRNVNGFEIERGRLAFEGFFIDPRLQYFINFDFDTDDEHVVIAHDFWVNYEFGRAFNLFFGKAYVPGSREWIDGSTRTQFADRSLATTFFRPDRSVGIWAIGELFDGVYYRAMLANGFNVSDLNFSDIDTNFAYSASTWWEAIGDYGRGYSDLEWHEDLALRLGTSATYAQDDGFGPLAQPPIEQNFVRLSDGTRLTLPGSLAPGTQVNQFDIYLLALDAAMKYRGFSLNGEYYLRWLQEIRGYAEGPPAVPVGFPALFDHGFYVAAGYFLIPERFEVIAKTSQIWGDYGSAAEYAGGFNWFPTGSHYLKFTFDATQLIGSPAQNTGPNYRAGDTGTLFRGQLQAAF